MKPYVVAISGASGAVYGVRFAQVLSGMGHEVILTLTDAARIVIQEEQGIDLGDIGQPDFLGKLFSPKQLDKIRYYHYKNLLAPIASGSFATQAMIVVPCSMSTLAQIANGASQNLLERAADVTIKERRRLVLVPRETPFSAIHLENMLKLSRLGVDIVPACPGFYSMPQTVQEMVDFVVGKVLDLIGIEGDLFNRWKGKDPSLKMEWEKS